jgi:uncharacterized protein (DUF433 family)
MVEVLSRHVVADPEHCQDGLTFRGTRVFVADVLDDVVDEYWWGSISSRWHGLPEEVITEAVLVAREVLLKHWRELLEPPGR